MNKHQVEQYALNLERRAIYDFLDFETVALLSSTDDTESLRQIQRRGLEAYETIRGKKIRCGSLELSRATTGIGLMLLLADQETKAIEG